MTQQDERNFRSQYYEKVGFRCVEEKRSLEPLLREPVVDGARLAQFVRLHLVPGIYRPLVWRLLLGVQPCHSEAAEFVAARRRETAADTERHLSVLRLVDERTPAAHRHWLGWLLNSGQLVQQPPGQLAAQLQLPQIQMAHLVMDLMDDPTDQLFVCCRLWQLQAAALAALPTQLGWLQAELGREDPLLFDHLTSFGLLETPASGPLPGWISALFCGVLPSSSVERLVDKLVAGADRLLALTAASLLLTHRHRLLAAEQPTAARALIERIVEDSDRVISRALDAWTRAH